MAELGTVVALIKSLGGQPDPEVVAEAVAAYLEEHPEATAPIDDTAGEGDTGKIWSADKSAEEIATLSSAIAYKTPEMFGAKGDGTTDDSQAVQDAVDAGYEVRFGDNKTYYLASTVTIDHDVHLIGGENTVIKTATPDGGDAYDGIKISGTLKKTTTLTTDYTSDGNTDNCNNKFTLSDMDGISIGDIMVVEATDQHYHYARQYYYLGATLLITDIYDGHIYTSDAMPYDITNTENVSVKVYSAPMAIVENMSFESSGFDGGNYKYLLSLSKCNGSIIKNCSFSNMDNGINVEHSVNTKIDNVALSKGKYDNSLSGDSYGVVIDSCNNTVVERVVATCAQHAISITGHLPAINTFIRHCELSAECRVHGLDTHEAVYNLVVEDCVLGTACLNGIVYVNRCRVFNNRRASNENTYVSIYGGHNPAWSSVVIENTKFEGDTGIIIRQSGLQSPVQTFNNVYGNIRIENCTGGSLNIVPATNETVLSNTIQNLTIRGWKDCKEIFVDGSWKAKKALIENTNFTEPLFINDHTGTGLVLGNIEYLDMINSSPMMRKCSIDRDTSGENLLLPEGVTISLSSSNTSAKYVVCGINIQSDNVDDYVIGSVTGSDGGTLSRTVVSGNATLTKDGSGNFVFTQGANSSSYSWYPVGMFYVSEMSVASISATLKNTGNTNGASFRPMIAIVDAETGTLIKRTNGTGETATAQGAEVSFSYNVGAGNIAMLYFYCNSAVSGAETTFEDFSVTCTPIFASPVVNQPYTAKRLTGDGTVTSLDGVNNIMCSDLNFHISLKADYVGNPVGVLPSGSGVSF